MNTQKQTNYSGICKVLRIENELGKYDLLSVLQEQEIMTYGSLSHYLDLLQRKHLTTPLILVIMIQGCKMKIEIIEDVDQTEVIIRCRKTNSEIIRLKSYIELFDQKLKANKNGRVYLVNSLNVLYFETVDNRTFLYTEDDVLEIKLRLFELELILSDKDFIRISKSVIVNINRIVSLKPEINRTIEATLSNGERIWISRKYAKAFRELLSV